MRAGEKGHRRTPRRIRVSGLDELNAFLLDPERSAGVPKLIEFGAGKDSSEKRWEAVVFTSDATFGSTAKTIGMDAESAEPDSDYYQARLAVEKHILTRAGYTDQEAGAAFENRLRLEKEMLTLTGDEQDSSGMLRMDELEKLHRGCVSL